MVTTNNVQGDEPQPTALERQVQTLTAVVERFTKQNQDLEDQEGTSVERRDLEGPDGSNALSRPERQDMSRPSITDMAPFHIVVEMQMMKERMDLMMNALKGRVSNDLNDLVHRIDSPFTTSVNSFTLSQKFCMP